MRSKIPLLVFCASILAIYCGYSQAAASSTFGNTLIGQPCQNSEQCVGQPDITSECPLTNPKNCRCKNNFTPRTDNTDCLPIVNEIGGECESGQRKQCTFGLPGQLSDCLPSHENPSKFVCNCTAVAVSAPGDNKCYKKASAIGEECVKDEQCRANLGEAECQGGATCQCKDGAPWNEEIGKCGLTGGTVLIGDPCNEDVECVGEPGVSSACLQNVCSCSTGFVPRNDSTNCLQIRNQLEAPCEENQQCTQGPIGSYSECAIPEKVCRCVSDAVHADDGGNTCYPRIDLIGESCSIEEQCQGIPGGSLCFQDQCACHEDSVPTQDNKECLLKKYLEETCSNPVECTHMEHADCLPSPPGASSSSCQCNPGYIQKSGVNDKCNQLASQVGDPCVGDDNQCSSLPGSICDPGSKKCECNTATHVLSKDGQKCLEKVSSLNEPCAEDDQCQVEHSVCFDSSGDGDGSKKCLCSLAFIPPPEAVDKCNPLAEKIGDKCDGHPNQCSNVEESVCEGVSKTCQCEEDTRVPSEDLSKCLLWVGALNGSCSESVQCRVPYSECRLGGDGEEGGMSCLCREEHYVESQVSAGICLPIVNHLNGEACQEDVQCQSGVPGILSQCTTTGTNYPVCQCTGEGVSAPEGDQCFKRATFLGDSCADHPVQCEDIERSICTDKSCKCNPTTDIPSEDLRKCIKTMGGLNSTCDGDHDCEVEHSECRMTPGNITGRCRCKQGEYVESEKRNDTCVKIVSELNQDCDETAQCRADAGLGQLSECRNGVCLCGHDYVYHYPTHHCFFPARLHGVCHSTEECLVGLGGNYSMCSMADDFLPRCRCLSSSIEFGDSCYARKVIGDSCNKDVECEVAIGGQVKCDVESKTCAFKAGYKRESDGQLCSGTMLWRGSKLFLLILSLIALMNQNY